MVSNPTWLIMIYDYMYIYIHISIYLTIFLSIYLSIYLSILYYIYYIKYQQLPFPKSLLISAFLFNSNSLHARLKATTRHGVYGVLTVLTGTTVRRSAVGQEDLKPYWESEKRPHFSSWSTILLFTIISKTLITTEGRLTNRMVVYSSRPFTNILKYRAHQWDLQKIWKTRLFQAHIEEFSLYVWKFRLTVL